MADYYPLLERAVSRLPASTREGRQALYDRARNALLTQMRNVTPPPAPDDIDREEKALTEAIARLEDELAAKAAAPATAEPPPAPASDSPPPKPEPVAKAEKPAPVEPSPAAPAQAPPRTLPRMGAARPQAPGLAGKIDIKGQLAPVPGAAGSFFARFRGRTDEGKPLPPAPLDAPPPAAATVPEQQESPKAPLSPRARLPGLPGSQRPSLPPVAETEPEPPVEAAPEQMAEAAPVEGEASEERREQMRPAAPLAATEQRNTARIAIFGAVIVATIGAIAMLAFQWRDNPEDYVRASRPAPVQEADSNTQRKIADRVGGSAQSTPQQPTRAANDATPAPQRSVMLIEAPDEPQRVKAVIGSANWRIDTSTTPNALVADVDLLTLGSASMRMLRNTDTRIPASHMLEIRFRLKADSDAPGVKAIDIVQMRADDRQTGDPLAGLQTPVTENFYLVGLSNVEPMSSRNIDLIKSRGWFDIPILLTNGRLAKLTIEKGAYGERLLNQALQSWQ